jgi:hypothetical protein
MPKPSAGNDDRAIVLATFCWTTVHSRPRRLPIRAKDPLWARWRDHDPSRIALWHGNSDFGRRAWRDHAELPDSVAELPFGCRGGLVARRFRCSRSGLDRTACRQGPESGSEHTETSCKTLHRQSETHQPPSPAQIPAGLQPRSDQACRRARASQGQALRVAAKKDAASLDRPCARRLRVLTVGAEECSRRGSNQRMDPAEQENAINRDRGFLLCSDSSPSSAWFLTAIHTCRWRAKASWSTCHLAPSPGAARTLDQIVFGRMGR